MVMSPRGANSELPSQRAPPQPVVAAAAPRHHIEIGGRAAGDGGVHGVLAGELDHRRRSGLSTNALVADVEQHAGAVDQRQRAVDAGESGKRAVLARWSPG